MSKVNEIQQALTAMSGGEFQKLADAYLVEQGLGRVNSIGSVVAANKAKVGTPDTLLTTVDGDYIFAEHTTQKTGLVEKMKRDLDKCLNESKTGIGQDRIDRVIFCFTGRLDVSGQNELVEYSQSKGVRVELFGIDTISYDLYSRYPGLARNFLGIKIDTGQIVTPSEFVSLYNNNKLATRLDLGFHFRESDLDRVLTGLEADNLVIVSGRAGVGKSRLALEACRRFGEEHAQYQQLCVFGRNRDLWEDLQVWFKRPGSYLIFVDDANRVSRFEYLVDLLQHQREDQRIKVLATVRGYALTKVQDASRPLGGGVEVNLGSFTDEQIKELVSQEYEITNYHYLTRIEEIARGNPRLAVMAAEVAKNEPLSSIHDVSALYDKYFSSIREELSQIGTDLQTGDLLKVAAIVSFFKAVDRTNVEMMAATEKAFGLTSAVFWEMAERLHELEMLDMHEDEVVRLSDQVLGTYLFYLATFKESVLDFGALIGQFFPNLQHRLIDSLNPVLNAFDSDRVVEAMRPHIDRAWAELEEAGDDSGLLHLLDMFWFAKRTETLLWITDRIRDMEPMSADISELSFEKSRDAVPAASILNLLRSFAFADEGEIETALYLILGYLAKRPKEAPLVLRVLVDAYGFRYDSYLRNYAVQRAVVDTLWSRAERGDDVFSRVFLAVAASYLPTYHENHGVKEQNVLQITRFDLVNTPELSELRRLIWQRLFALFEDEALRTNILEIIREYSRGAFQVADSEIIVNDSRYVLPFLDSALDSGSYGHCRVMHDYLRFVEKHGVIFDDEVRDRYSNETYALAEILLPRRLERQGLELSFEEYEQYRRDRLDHYTEGFTFDDYAKFFERCLEIQDTQDGGNAEYQLGRGVEYVLKHLAERNPDLLEEVLAHYLSIGDPLRLFGLGLVKRILDLRGYDWAIQLLSKPEYTTRRRWLFHVYQSLPGDAVNEDRLNKLFQLYELAEPGDFPQSMDYLLKYHSLDSRVVAKVVARILEKAEDEPNGVFTLQMLFNSSTEVARQLPDLFKDDVELLKRAYLALEKTSHHSDYHGQVFDKLIDLCPAFVDEFIDWKYANAEHGWVNSHDDHRHYNFVWARPDYKQVTDRIVDRVFDHEKDSLIAIDPYLRKFFVAENRSESQKKQNKYLLGVIRNRCHDVAFMAFLFGVISKFRAERRLQFVERFLQHNEDFDAFRLLPLEPSSWTAHGSWVPVLQDRIEFWESLRPIMNTVALLQHKQYVEQFVNELRTQIEREKKKDFIGD